MSGMNMQWEETNSPGWALQSISPRLVNKLTDIIEDSDDLIVDIDSIFHTLSTKLQTPLDVLVLMPDIGCIVNDEQFGDTVPMRSQDILPFEGMGRYKLENKNPHFTINNTDPDDPYWKDSAPEVNLAGRDFSGWVLRGVELQKRDLTICNFTGADLRNTKLDASNLAEANLTRANLRGATGFSKDEHEGVLLDQTTLPDGTISD